jgi:hypothetical protein
MGHDMAPVPMIISRSDEEMADLAGGERDQLVILAVRRCLPTGIRSLGGACGDGGQAGVDQLALR